MSLLAYGSFFTVLPLLCVGTAFATMATGRNTMIAITQQNQTLWVIKQSLELAGKYQLTADHNESSKAADASVHGH